MSVDKIIDGILGREGGYSNNPADRGGETMWGITAATARAAGYAGAMRDLSRAQAVAIYRDRYFVGPGFAAVAQRSVPIAEELTDTGVNCGPAVAAGFLQRALNAFNQQGTLYADIAVDAAIGPRTLAALDAYLAKRGAEGEAVMIKALNGLQTARYFEITENRAANEAFFYGWLRTRV